MMLESNLLRVSLFAAAIALLSGAAIGQEPKRLVLPPLPSSPQAGAAQAPPQLLGASRQGQTRPLTPPPLPPREPAPEELPPTSAPPGSSNPAPTGTGSSAFGESMRDIQLDIVSDPRQLQLPIAQQTIDSQGSIIVRSLPPVSTPPSNMYPPDRLCHGGLCFEEPNLERYGFHFGCGQYALSAASFFARIPTLPYQMAADPQYGCRPHPGYFPRVTPLPLRDVAPPPSIKGGAVQAAAIVGTVFLIP